MSYLVLARKFRPQTFSSIVGQEHITRALANAIIHNRVPHALLFTGPRGVGKTTSARVLARALNCTGRELPQHSTNDTVVVGDTALVGTDSIATELGSDLVAAIEPCGECSNCKEIARSASIAVWEIDGASNNSVENVRDLIDSLRSLPPPGSRYKIYIIDEVHMLSVAAFNALLKSLEEPPPNTIFIFATTEPHKIPETVISRCQRHDFRRISVKVIRQTLEQLAEAEGILVEEGVCEFIALKARGGMRDAQSMLDRLISFSVDKLSLSDAHQVFGVVDSGFYLRLSNAVLSRDVELALELIAEAFGQSLDVRTFLAEFLLHWRNVLIASTRKTGIVDSKLAEILEIPKRDATQILKQLEGRELFDIQRLFDLAERAVETALSSNFPRYVLEAGIVKMATLADLRPLAEVLGGLQGGMQGGIQGGMKGGNSSGVQAAAVAAIAQPRASAEGARVKLEQDVIVPTRDIRSDKSAVTPPVSAALAKELPIESSRDSVVEEKPEFNPSWQDFLNFLRTRSEIVLATFLRRVSAPVFLDGRLSIEGGSFDIDSLKESRSLNSLKVGLAAYSGIETWDIRFSVVAPHGDTASEANNANAPRPRTGPVPGSVAMLEAQIEKERVVRVDTEARNSQVVKKALSVFEGSSVERVSVMKREPS